MRGKILIFTGKGGVGKTSIAAAHAVKAAAKGFRTLVVSTDMAHNLSDMFEKKIGSEPAPLMENLWGLEIDPNHEMSLRYGNIKEAIRKTMNLEEDAEESYEDIIVFPGMEEIFSLVRIKEIFEQEKYDLIIMDCAPTGETLSLLKFPELLSWYIERFLPLGKVLLKILRPISRRFFKVELPDKRAVSDIEKLFILLFELQNLLKDRGLCSIRIVTIPEKMVIEETKRSFMYMNLYDFNVDGIYINRIIPPEVKNNFFNQWKELQAGYVSEIKSSFADVPLYSVKWYESDINGIPGLERIIADSLEDDSVLDIREIKPSESFEKTESGYQFSINLPFTQRQNFELFESGTDIIIKANNFRRSIPLPDTIRAFRIDSADFADSRLIIRFGKGA